MNPLGLRIIALFDSTGDDQINFKQFCQTLSAFRPEAPINDKLDLCFRVYDADNDGKINRRELHNVLKGMVGANIAEDQLWQLVDKVIVDSKAYRDSRKQTDDPDAEPSRSSKEEDDDDVVTREDFEWAMTNAQLRNKLSIRL